MRKPVIHIFSFRIIHYGKIRKRSYDNGANSVVQYHFKLKNIVLKVKDWQYVWYVTTKIDDI